MNFQGTVNSSVKRRGCLRTMLAALALLTVSSAAHAVEERKIQELVDRSRFTLELFNKDQEMQQFRDFVPYAHAMLIVPNYIKGAFAVGAAGGPGVLILRDPATGHWSSPAFYSLRSASIGLQVGGSSAEMILIFMTDKGIQELNSTSVKLGVDASVAAGTVGYGVEGATPMNFSADIAAFSRVKGLFMGTSLSGTSMVVKSDWNHKYYDSPVSPMEILHGQATHPGADELSRMAARFFADNARR